MKKITKTIIGVAFMGASLLAAGCGGGSGSGAGVTQAVGASTNQVPTTKTLPAPTGVTATSGINKVTLSWDPVPGADSYNIYWSVNPGVTTATGTKITGVASPYQHVGLYVSRVYFYVVTAVNSTGESVASSQASTVAATDSDNLYAANCQGCHGPVTATTIMHGTPDKIAAAIANNTGGMGVLSTLSADQINIISEQLPCH